jgi:hypothetical protein
MVAIIAECSLPGPSVSWAGRTKRARGHRGAAGRRNPRGGPSGEPPERAPARPRYPRQIRTTATRCPHARVGDGLRPGTDRRRMTEVAVTVAALNQMLERGWRNIKPRSPGRVCRLIRATRSQRRVLWLREVARPCGASIHSGADRQSWCPGRQYLYAMLG